MRSLSDVQHCSHSYCLSDMQVGCSSTTLPIMVVLTFENVVCAQLAATEAKLQLVKQQLAAAYRSEVKKRTM